MTRDSKLSALAFGRNTTEFYRDSLLKPVYTAAEELIKSGDTVQIATDLFDIFYLWKEDHGGRPLTQFTRGILGDNAFDDTNKSSENKAKRTSAFENAEPYDCAGFGVKNYTDLAFKLWLDDYQPFRNLCKAYSLDRVLALTSLLLDNSSEAYSSDIDSLVRLSCFLYDEQVSYYRSKAKFFEKNSNKGKTLAGLDNRARKKGSEANKLKSEQAKIQFRKVGADLWRRNPGYNYQRVAYELFSNHNIPKNKQGDKYSETHIRRLIRGIKDEL